MTSTPAWPARAATALALATLGLLGGAGAAGAHGGDAELVHGCIAPGGNVKIVAADGTCAKSDVPLDWPAVGAVGATYSAGTGLALSSDNVFSVSSVPWNVLTGIPADLADGDDDGSGQVNGLRRDLAADDGVPDEPTDLVSFSKIKDLTAASGDGRITGAFISNGSIRGQDIGEQAITARNLAGDDQNGTVGAVTSEKIADRSIGSRDLAAGVLDRTVTTLPVDPPSIPAASRTAVTVPLPVDPADLVTVSPPAALEDQLLFVGSDVLVPGELTIYLYNNAAGTATDGNAHTWTVRRLRVGG